MNGLGLSTKYIWLYILDLIEKWKIIAKTKQTCNGDPLSEEKGISEKQCIEYAKLDDNANFAFYASKTAQWKDSALCALYKSCDLNKEGTIPERPGKTFEKNSVGKYHNFEFRFCIKHKGKLYNKNHIA